MMGFIKDINSIRWIRENGTATQRKIDQYQVVVGHNHIDRVQLVTRLVEETAAVVATLEPGTLSGLCGDWRPLLVGQHAVPVIPIAAPLFATDALQHLLV